MGDHSTESVIAGIVESLTNGVTAWLATVIETWGSSPRPAGSMMVWSEFTGTIGSVSGGCIEEDVLDKISGNQLVKTSPTILYYGDDHNSLFQLPCGGRMAILVEPLIAEAKQLSDWQQCLAELKNRRGILRAINTASGFWQWQKSLPIALNYQFDKLQYFMGPVKKLLIIGANPTSEYLAEFAIAIGFKVTICDPTEGLNAKWHQSKVFDFVRAYPDGFIARDFSDDQSAIVSVSHDPRLDDMALLEALPTNAFYIGAMGSLATSDKRRQRLRALQITDSDLAKLHAPIGIDIGSKTPAEIAISIVAHLTQVYRCKNRSAQ